MITDPIFWSTILGAVIAVTTSLIGETARYFLQRQQLRHEEELKLAQWNREQNAKESDREREQKQKSSEELQSNVLEAYQNALYWLKSVEISYQQAVLDRVALKEEVSQASKWATLFITRVLPYISEQETIVLSKSLNSFIGEFDENAHILSNNILQVGLPVVSKMLLTAKSTIIKEAPPPVKQNTLLKGAIEDISSEELETLIDDLPNETRLKLIRLLSNRSKKQQSKDITD